MKIKTTGESLTKQLSVIAKLAVPSTGVLNIEVKENNLYMYSSNDTANFKSVLPCDKVEGEAEFGIYYDVLRSALSGKKGELSLEFVNDTLVIQSGRYKAELAVVEFVAPVTDNPSDATEWKLTPQQNTWLNNACNITSLAVVDDLSPFMPTTIKLTDKGAFVVCYDANRMSFIRSKKITGNLDITLPSQLLTSVFSAFQGLTYKLLVTSQSLIVQSELMSIRMALPTIQSTIDISQLLSLANHVLKAETKDIKIKTEDFWNFMSSCRAIITKERLGITATAKGKNLLLRAKTINGSISEKLEMETQTNVEFSVDFAYVEDAAKKVKEEFITIKVLPNESILLGAKNGWTVVSVYG